MLRTSGRFINFDGRYFTNVYPTFSGWCEFYNKKNNMLANIAGYGNAGAGSGMGNVFTLPYTNTSRVKSFTNPNTVDQYDPFYASVKYNGLFELTHTPNFNTNHKKYFNDYMLYSTDFVPRLCFSGTNTTKVTSAIASSCDFRFTYGNYSNTITFTPNSAKYIYYNNFGEISSYNITDWNGNTTNDVATITKVSNTNYTLNTFTYRILVDGKNGHVSSYFGDSRNSFSNLYVGSASPTTGSVLPFSSKRDNLLFQSQGAQTSAWQKSYRYGIITKYGYSGYKLPLGKTSLTLEDLENM